MRRLVPSSSIVLRYLYFVIPLNHLFINIVVISLNILFLSKREFMDNDKFQLIGWGLWQLVSICCLMIAQINSAIIFYKLSRAKKTGMGMDLERTELTETETEIKMGNDLEGHEGESDGSTVNIAMEGSI
jgi:hypothetical protein